jgi:uncharacterized protein
MVDDEIQRANRMQNDLSPAAINGDIKAVREHLDGDANLARAFDRNGWTPLHLAAHYGHLDVVELLLERGADIHAKSSNTVEQMPIFLALGGRQYEMVEFLLEHGADVDSRQKKDWSLLHQAAIHGDLRMARILLSHGAQVNSQRMDGMTPFDLAKEKHHTEMCDLLSEYGGRSHIINWRLPPDDMKPDGMWYRPQ